MENEEKAREVKSEPQVPTKYNFRSTYLVFQITNNLICTHNEIALDLFLNQNSEWIIQILMN